MDFPQFIQVFKSLVGESFRHAIASRLLPIIIGYALLILMLAATIHFHNIPSSNGMDTIERAPLEEVQRLGREAAEKSGIPIIQGEIRLLFGAIRIPWGNFRENAVRYLESLLVFFSSDAIGLIFAIIWTGAFIPEFFQGFWWSMFRIRPVPLGLLLCAKVASVLVVFLTFGVILIFGTWLVLGISTGGWNELFLWSLFVMLLQFISFYPVSVYFGVLSRNTMVAMVATLAFWALCWFINQARISFFSSEDSNTTFSLLATMIDFGYWILPKPIDFSIILSDLLGSMKDSPPPVSWSMAWQKGKIIPILSISTSFLSGLVFLWFASMELKNPTKE